MSKNLIFNSNSLNDKPKTVATVLGINENTNNIATVSTVNTLNELKILSSLSSSDKYGLEMVEDLKTKGSLIFLGSIYNVLNRLEREGLIESYWGETTIERNGSRRRYYKITEDGKKALDVERFALTNLWSFAY